MSLEALRREVRSLLAEADDKVRTAVKALTTGSEERRVAAAGQLVYLRRRRDELEERMTALDHCPDDTAHTLGEWIKEDWMILMQRLESWIEAGR
jgi:hypothetical protein